MTSDDLVYWLAGQPGGGSGGGGGGGRLTGAALLRVRGNMCNLYDGTGSGDTSIIYTPVMPTVYVREPGRFDLWCEVLRANGSTHVLLNVPDGGPSYNGVWDQPDLWHDLPTYRRVLEACLDRGLAPMIWLDWGGPSPLPRIHERWPRFAAEMWSLFPYLIGIPACEPVIGDWSSYEVSESLRLLHGLMPGMAIGYHGSPERLVGSSNPVELDDPWQGGEAEFYREHGGQYIDLACYQTAHGSALYQSCGKHSRYELEDYQCTCWVSRYWEYLIRIAGGYHGWRPMAYCVLESVAYEFIRGQARPEQARDVATIAKDVAEMYGLTVGHGNGLPR